MGKLYDWLFSSRCQNCGTALINQKVYIVREPETSGVASAFSCNEPDLYNAVDCPRYGKQQVVGKYYRMACRKVANDG